MTVSQETGLKVTLSGTGLDGQTHSSQGREVGSDCGKVAQLLFVSDIGC